MHFGSVFIHNYLKHVKYDWKLLKADTVLQKNYKAEVKNKFELLEKEEDIEENGKCF